MRFFWKWTKSKESCQNKVFFAKDELQPCVSDCDRDTMRHNETCDKLQHAASYQIHNNSQDLTINHLKRVSTCRLLHVCCNTLRHTAIRTHAHAHMCTHVHTHTHTHRGTHTHTHTPRDTHTQKHFIILGHALMKTGWWKEPDTPTKRSPHNDQKCHTIWYTELYTMIIRALHSDSKRNYRGRDYTVFLE